MFQPVELKGLPSVRDKTPILQQRSQETSKRQIVFNSILKKKKKIPVLERGKNGFEDPDGEKTLLFPQS